MIGMLAFEFDRLFRDLHVVLADWADFPLLLDLLPCQFLQILLGQPLRDFAYLISQF